MVGMLSMYLPTAIGIPWVYIPKPMSSRDFVLMVGPQAAK